MDNSIQIDLINNINKRLKLLDKEDNDSCKMKIKTKTKILNFFLQNEIKISEILKKVVYYKNYFNILIEYNYMKIANINDKNIKKIIENEEKKEKYVLCKYNHHKSIDFVDFVFNLPNPKLFIFHILDSYKHLLDILIKINENNICFFNLSSINICFHDNYRPFINNFEKSILISELDVNYITSIIERTNNFVNKPLEVHVLFYLMKNDELTLSYTFIECICDNYVKQLNILDFFPEIDKSIYKKECIESLKKYINQPKEGIIIDILKNVIIWDNYSLSILYLHSFCNIIQNFSLKDTFMNEFVNILLKNIHPNPSKRETLKNTQEIHDKLLNDFNNWNFVNNISCDKMEQMYLSLSN